jgi:hypothetical protein
MTDGNGFPLQPRSNRLDPLPVDIVNKLPINVYSEGLVKNENCAVCLEDFVPGKNDLRILPCGHGFCVLCIDPWLTQKSTMCPICKWDCLPADLRAERDLLLHPEHAIPEPTHEPHLETIAPMEDRPSSSTNIEYTNAPHVTIPPILTTVSPPPSSPTQEKQPTLEDDTRIQMPESEASRKETLDDPFMDPSSSTLHSVPPTSTHIVDDDEPPAFTTVELSDKPSKA